MTSPAPTPDPGLRKLITAKAALVRHRGASDPGTLAVAAELRLAQLTRVIKQALETEPPLTSTERAELAALLLTETGA